MTMVKLRCVLVDDEPLALEILEAYIEKIPWLEHVRSIDSGLEALKFLKEDNVDIVFLDIQMPDLSGIQVAEILNQRYDIIFTTAYNQYAVEGFELEARDYLLKPVSFERFLKAVEKVAADKTASPAESPDHFYVKTEYKIKKVRFDEILYIEGMKDYLRIVTKQEKIMTLQSFSRLVPVLPAERFMRIHKSFVIAFEAIDSVEKNKVRMGEQLIPIGDSYREQFLQKINARLI